MIYQRILARSQTIRLGIVIAPVKFLQMSSADTVCDNEASHFEDKDVLSSHDVLDLPVKAIRENFSTIVDVGFSHKTTTSQERPCHLYEEAEPRSHQPSAMHIVCRKKGSQSSHSW